MASRPERNLNAAPSEIRQLARNASVFRRNAHAIIFRCGLRNPNQNSKSSENCSCLGIPALFGVENDGSALFSGP